MLGQVFLRGYYTVFNYEEPSMMMLRSSEEVDKALGRPYSSGVAVFAIVVSVAVAIVVGIILGLCCKKRRVRMKVSEEDEEMDTGNQHYLSVTALYEEAPELERETI